MDLSMPSKILFIGVLVLLAGCSGAVSDPADEDFEEGLSITEPVDRDNDGKYSTFKITSKAEITELETYALRIWVNGTWNGQTIPADGNVRATNHITFNETHLEGFEAGDLNVTIGLADPDTPRNQTLRTWSTTVPYEPISEDTETDSEPNTSPAPDAEDQTDSETPAGSESADSEAEAPGPSEGTEWTVTVTRVVDGDTIEVRFPNGETDTLRLLGVDTPETSFGSVSPDEFEGISDGYDGQDHLFNWGEKATTYAEEELAGKEVQIEVDEEADRRGYYGRLLVYIYVDGENFNKQLLTNGYARVYESDFSKLSEFEAAESQAQADNVGLWDYTAPSTDGSDSNDETTSDTGTDGGGSDVSADDLYVSNVHADADGNDHENLNDEYIELSIIGSGTLDMGGWTLKDDAGHTYTFPSSFELGGSESVTIYTGDGSDSDTSLYWGSSSAIWNNGGDTIIIEDSSGSVVLEHGY